MTAALLPGRGRHAAGGGSSNPKPCPDAFDPRRVVPIKIPELLRHCLAFFIECHKYSVLLASVPQVPAPQASGTANCCCLLCRYHFCIPPQPGCCQGVTFRGRSEDCLDFVTEHAQLNAFVVLRSYSRCEDAA